MTGLLMLYHNILQSLFESQIMMLGVVVLALMGMFLILFRSFLNHSVPKSTTIGRAKGLRKALRRGLLVAAN